MRAAGVWAEAEKERYRGKDRDRGSGRDRDRGTVRYRGTVRDMDRGDLDRSG